MESIRFLALEIVFDGIFFWKGHKAHTKCRTDINQNARPERSQGVHDECVFNHNAHREVHHCYNGYCNNILIQWLVTIPLLRDTYGVVVPVRFSWGLDQLRSGILQQQKSFNQSSQPFNQLQFLSPQQQQLVLQAQQNLTSSTGDIDSMKLRMLLNSRNIGLGKDGHSSTIGDAISNAGSPMQSGCPVIPRPETDMLSKMWLM